MRSNRQLSLLAASDRLSSLLAEKKKRSKRRRRVDTSMLLGMLGPKADPQMANLVRELVKTIEELQDDLEEAEDSDPEDKGFFSGLWDTLAGVLPSLVSALPALL